MAEISAIDLKGVLHSSRSAVVEERNSMYTFDWLHKRQELMPEKTALVDLETNREWTYSQLNDRASRFAWFLQDELKLKKDDRIAILAHNSSDYIEMLYGSAKVGVILVCLNWRLALPELEYIIEDCTPECLIYAPDFEENAGKLHEKGLVSSLVVIGEGSHEDRLTYEEALQRSDGSPVVMPPKRLDETWHLIYTSGTTGRPKGVIQTFGMVFYNAVNIALTSGLTHEDVTLNLLPFFHTGGLNLYTNPTIHVGGTALIQKSFDPDKTLEVLSKRATLIFAVPAVYRFLSQHPNFEKTEFQHMREWECGGEAMPLSLLELYEKRGIVIRQGFGMTETGPTVFLVDKENAIKKGGSIGRAVMHVQVRCVDERGNDLTAGEKGELLIKGPGVTPGYWNNPEETEKAIDEEGWLHSGDVVEYDEDGYFYIVDRIKDMYISGGENVYPAEIENLLDEIPQVLEASVVGVPDKRWGEVGMVFAVLRPDEQASESDVLEYLEGKLARYKIPKSVRFIDQLPRNETGKIMKTELRRLAGEQGSG
jgi:fatty-acyl-CoA synthase